MDKNTSMIRFLMFMILALVIFFNLAPQAVVDDNNDDENVDKSDNTEEDSDSNDTSITSKYCLTDGTSDEEKICKQIQDGEVCQNEFDTKEECEKLKSASEDENVNTDYKYTTDDVDKMTIMSSDDMIYCLKNDKECKEMKFGDCHDIHIGTYIDAANCEAAKTA